jgi:hypothetical protein
MEPPKHLNNIYMVDQDSKRKGDKWKRKKR